MRLSSIVFHALQKLSYFLPFPFSRYNLLLKRAQLDPFILPSFASVRDYGMLVLFSFFFSHQCVLLFISHSPFLVMSSSFVNLLSSLLPSTFSRNTSFCLTLLFKPEQDHLCHTPFEESLYQGNIERQKNNLFFLPIEAFKNPLSSIAICTFCSQIISLYVTP